MASFGRIAKSAAGLSPPLKYVPLLLTLGGVGAWAVNNSYRHVEFDPTIQAGERKRTETWELSDKLEEEGREYEAKKEERRDALAAVNSTLHPAETPTMRKLAGKEDLAGRPVRE